MYAINKQILKQQQPMMHTEIKNALQEIIPDFINNANNQYYMLLCRELNDYTVFNLSVFDFDKIIAELETCFESRGLVYSINPGIGEGIEIWIKEIDSEEINCYIFFPYNMGVIEV